MTIKFHTQGKYQLKSFFYIARYEALVCSECDWRGHEEEDCANLFGIEEPDFIWGDFADYSDGLIAKSRTIFNHNTGDVIIHVTLAKTAKNKKELEIAVDQIIGQCSDGIGEVYEQQVKLDDDGNVYYLSMWYDGQDQHIYCRPTLPAVHIPVIRRYFEK